MHTTPCPSCKRPKGVGSYLCAACWAALPGAARAALSRRDSRARALARYREMQQQLDGGRRVTEIEVSP